jgi:hypothetical protein
MISVVLLLAGGASLAVSPEGQSAPGQRLSCGGDRWPVKTLSDKRAHLVNFHPRHTTVYRLRHKRRPRVVESDSPRLRRAERKTFRVRARLIEFARRGDHDIHMVIAQPRQPSRTMIVEFPNVHCNGARRSIKKRAMRGARTHLTAACGSPSTQFTDLDGGATITGVGFWDLFKGQTGQAPNAIELHPVLKFAHATC